MRIQITIESHQLYRFALLTEFLVWSVAIFIPSLSLLEYAVLRMTFGSVALMPMGEAVVGDIRRGLEYDFRGYGFVVLFALLVPVVAYITALFLNEKQAVRDRRKKALNKEVWA